MVLELYTNSKLSQKINFNQGIVFKHKASSNCWQENSKQQLEIVDLVEAGACPKKTFKSANRAKKDINYFKL